MQRLNDLSLRSNLSGVYGGTGIKYIDFVKQWHKMHPEYTWHQAMKMASPEYEAMYHGMGYIPHPLTHEEAVKRAKKGIRTKRNTYIDGMNELEYEAREAARTKRRRNEYPETARKMVETKLRRGEIQHSKLLGLGGYGTKAGAKKAVATKRRKMIDGMNELEYETLKGLQTKLNRGEISQSKALQKAQKLGEFGGYGTKAGARKAVETKLRRGEIKHSKLLGLGYEPEWVRKELLTKLSRGEIQHTPSLSGGICPYCACRGGCEYCYGMGVLAGGRQR